ncbi:MAG: hypothetical protein ACLQFR_00715 [Streptosporangiaceae bacterium]
MLPLAALDRGGKSAGVTDDRNDHDRLGWQHCNAFIGCGVAQVQGHHELGLVRDHLLSQDGQFWRQRRVAQPIHHLVSRQLWEYAEGIRRGLALLGL